MGWWVGGGVSWELGSGVCLGDGGEGELWLDVADIGWVPRRGDEAKG